MRQDRSTYAPYRVHAAKASVRLKKFAIVVMKKKKKKWRRKRRLLPPQIFANGCYSRERVKVAKRKYRPACMVPDLCACVLVYISLAVQVSVLFLTDSLRLLLKKFFFILLFLCHYPSW